MSRTTTCRPSDAATPHEPERKPTGKFGEQLGDGGRKAARRRQAELAARAVEQHDRRADAGMQLLDEPHDR